jgi:hypothetical protein
VSAPRLTLALLAGDGLVRARPGGPACDGEQLILGDQLKRVVGATFLNSQCSSCGGNCLACSGKPKCAPSELL